MQTIWKYPVPIEGDGILRIKLPENAEVLGVQMQHEEPQMWVYIKDMAPTSFETRTFQWVGTGHEHDFDVTPTYIGTVQMNAGYLVFHLFELVR